MRITAIYSSSDTGLQLSRKPSSPLFDRILKEYAKQAGSNKNPSKALVQILPVRVSTLIDTD